MNFTHERGQLSVYGDHLEGSVEIPNSTDSWQKCFDGCNKLIKRINSSGGNATMLYLSDKEMNGNICLCKIKIILILLI